MKAPEKSEPPGPPRGTENPENEPAGVWTCSLRRPFGLKICWTFFLEVVKFPSTFSESAEELSVYWLHRTSEGLNLTGFRLNALADCL